MIARAIHGFTVALVLIPLMLGLASAQDLDAAQTRFFRSSAATTMALASALERAAPDARGPIEHALREVRAERERVISELAEAATLSGAEGRVRAWRAVDRGTNTHLRVLGDVMGQVPAEAKPAVARAMEVSRTGRDSALEAVEHGDGGGAAEARRGPARFEGRRPAGVGSGAPSHLRTGPPAGIQPGPPAGVGPARGRGGPH